jgi:hypothetical protein
MCTDEPLNKLRCAECPQIKLEKFLEASIKAALIILGGVVVWNYCDEPINGTRSLLLRAKGQIL